MAEPIRTPSQLHRALADARGGLAVLRRMARSDR